MLCFYKTKANNDMETLLYISVSLMYYIHNQPHFLKIRFPYLLTRIIYVKDTEVSLVISETQAKIQVKGLIISKPSDNH